MLYIEPYSPHEELTDDIGFLVAIAALLYD
ncbi:MAG: hypothetical protein ACJASG_000047 [Oleiphilaceae bacterium]|jgi:hypothetical protein